MAKQITAKCRSWRRGEDLTQSQAAARFNMERATWNRIETGKTIPRAETMIDIYIETHGLIVPNDYYDLPQLQVLGRAA